MLRCRSLWCLVRSHETLMAIGICTATAAAPALADWPNNGGNPGRNGQTPHSGPQTGQILWAAPATFPSAIISYQPVIEGDRVYLVRQNNFIPNNVPND